MANASRGALSSRGILGIVALAALVTACTRHAPTGIRAGSVIHGRLAASDLRLADDSVADDYNLELQSGQSVTIVLRGGAMQGRPGSRLDMYAILYFQNAEVAHDDDSAGNLNSRILFVAPRAGVYTVRATTYGAGFRAGDYILQVYAGLAPSGP